MYNLYSSNLRGQQIELFLETVAFVIQYKVICNAVKFIYYTNTLIVVTRRIVLDHALIFKSNVRAILPGY